jgi:beta-alanine--pyruvate transaminase
MATYLEEAIHSLRGRPRIIDIRNLGLVAAIELEPRGDRSGTRAFDVFLDCFEQGLLVRSTGDNIALSPPLIVERAHIDQMVEALGRAVERVS